MNDLQRIVLLQDKWNLSPILRIGNLLHSTNAVFGTSKIKNSFDKTNSATILPDLACIVPPKQRYNGNKHHKGVYIQ